MHFVIQRKSDRKYLTFDDNWAQTLDNAKRFYTEFAAKTFCICHEEDQCDIFIRLPSGTLVPYKREEDFNR